MAKMSLEQLRQMRNEVKAEMQHRETEGKDVHIIVGMATCGIAAGAKDTLDAFLDALQEHKLTNVSVKQTGCMGFCGQEPSVEVLVPEMPSAIYAKVDRNLAEEIVERHILQKTLLEGHIVEAGSASI